MKTVTLFSKAYRDLLMFYDERQDSALKSFNSLKAETHTHWFLAEDTLLIICSDCISLLFF